MDSHIAYKIGRKGSSSKWGGGGVLYEALGSMEWKRRKDSQECVQMNVEDIHYVYVH